MRKRRAQGQQAAASGVFSWVVFYAFRSPLWRGLDNLSRLSADHVLDKVSFSVPEGSIVGLIGENGAGTSYQSVYSSERKYPFAIQYCTHYSCHFLFRIT